MSTHRVARTTRQSNGPVSRLGRAALNYAARYDWRVFPVAPKSKVPLFKGWPKLATADPERITAWWRANPQCNVGLHCGPTSGVVVLDLDLEPGGLRWWADQLDIHGPLDTLEARTSKGGNPMMFPDLRVQLANAEIQRDEAREQLADTKANLAYVLMEHGKAWSIVHLLKHDLAEAQADVRALAEALQMHRTHGHPFHGCTGCESRRDNALARPSVVRVLAEKELNGGHER